jgi:hypothetical protein
MKHIDVLQIVTQILPFVGAEDPQGEANQRPQVHHWVAASEVLTEFVNLSVTIVATGDAVVRSRCLDLLVLELSEFETLFLITRLEKTAAAATAIIIGPVGFHVDKVFFTDNRLDHKPEVFGDGVAVALANDLAGVLHRELDFEILVPIGIDLELAFANPFGVVFVDVFDLKIMLEIKFFQSGPD